MRLAQSSPSARAVGAAVHPLPSVNYPVSVRKILTLSPRRRAVTLATPAPSHPALASSDPFVIELADKLEESVASTSSPALQPLRDSAAAALVKSPWPSRKNDAFRFTDMTYLKKRPVDPTPRPGLDTLPLIPSSPFSSAVRVVDGQFKRELSVLGSLPAEVFVGDLSSLPTGVVYDRVTTVIAKNAAFDQKDLFWDFNGIGVPDVLVVYVSPGVRILEPIHFQFAYSKSGVGEAAITMSNPRVVVIVDEGAEMAIVEEHFGVGGVEDECYWANAVVEIEVRREAKVLHSYVQRQALSAAHIKWTVVRQKELSKYELVEVSTGGRLSRHNLHVQQEGPETVTDLSTFHLSSRSSQIQDLHSRLVLDHPRGFSRQLHKCIVCDSGRGVFDGNIKVNRLAQQTDAGQQTKSLLLSPQALVNVRPNLQIVADDVKCAHGAAISGEIDKNELFYFRSRGIDKKTAMEAVIFSFGTHVINRIPYPEIRKAIGEEVRELLRLSKRYIE